MREELLRWWLGNLIRHSNEVLFQVNGWWKTQHNVRSQATSGAIHAATPAALQDLYRIYLLSKLKQ